MASASDSAWLNEAVIRFLQGPLYSTPLMSFIDNKCHIFDTEEECKLEYTNVHEEFKNVRVARRAVRRAAPRAGTGAHGEARVRSGRHAHHPLRQSHRSLAYARGAAAPTDVLASSH